MKHSAWIILIAVAAVFACKPVKKIQNVVTPKQDTVAIKTEQKKPFDSAAFKQQIIENLNKNKIVFTYFLGKIKLDYDDSEGKSINANAFVRIKKDSIIWLSITGPLNIEGYRVLVKPDTVIVMDKLNKTISYKSVAYLQEIIKLPLDFYTVQDLLIGNPVFFGKNIVSFRNAGNTLLALSAGNFFKHLLTIDTTDNRILHSKLDDVEETKNRTCDITFSDYHNQQGRLFSNTRQIIVTEKEKKEIKLDYKQVVFDEPQSFPFNIPKNYKVK
jgi:hypothetical protein